MKKILSVLIALIMALGVFSGCAPKENAGGTSLNSSGGITSQNESADSQSTSSTQSTQVDFSQTGKDMFTSRDSKTEYESSKAVTIKLNGSSATASSNSVKISGSKITITEEATYTISGKLTDGMIIVNAPENAKPQLVLSGAEITSKTSAALYVLESDKVFVTLASGTKNTLSNGGSFKAIDDNNIDAALFSKQDLTLNGNGSLTVTSPAGHGIVCKDDLVITSGSLTVNASSHGLDANDSVRISSASLNIDAGKDAIHAENTDDASLGFVYIGGGSIKGEAEGDGIAASAYLQIEGGSIDLLVGGGSENGTKASSGNYGDFMGGGPGGMRPGSAQTTTSTTDTVSMKGLKAATGISITGGSIKVNSADDSVHSDSSITIGGGTLKLSSGDDAIHAEETLTVTAGKISILESYEGLEALHIDIKGGDINLTASDDGLNAAGGTDSSGTEGGRDGMFGGGFGGGRPGGRPGGMGGGGGMSSNSNGSIKISGGTLYINSSGDGLDANGTLEISGGHTTVVGPTRGDTATLDYDKSGTITGGTFIGTGAQGMAQSFSDSTQGVIAVSVGNQSAGTEITLKNSGGKTLITHKPELDFAVVILSSPDIKKGNTYTITVGSQSAEFEAN